MDTTLLYYQAISCIYLVVLRKYTQVVFGCSLQEWQMLAHRIRLEERVSEVENQHIRSELVVLEPVLYSQKRTRQERRTCKQKRSQASSKIYTASI
jgi:hypothetical protein